MRLSLGGFVLAIICDFIDMALNFWSFFADHFLLAPV
ncbi:hypothetical protein PMIT1320_01791 [Prochlorococcus marinus str. MIT 1320]|nr:hypothetical protein PMIT1320_01791 [Prochlorococcus marinus str. MIT 1320]